MNVSERLPRTAIIILVFSLALICIGILLSVNSCASTEVREGEEFTVNPGNSNSSNGDANYEGPYPSHYADLDLVDAPKGLNQQHKQYTGFKVSFNSDNKTPNYVTWELLGSEVSNAVDRTDNFWQDTEIKGCPTSRDYTGSGYDRGHICPAADQKWSLEAMNDCFVMANICPQDHQLNAGAWNTLENKERQWAQRDSAIIIVAGPIYSEEDNKRIGNAGVRVPGAFFKAIIAPYSENPKGIAFVYPNMASPGNMESYAMSIDEVEEITGLDLFYALPDDIENKIEAEFSFKEWNSSK